MFLFCDRAENLQSPIWQNTKVSSWTVFYDRTHPLAVQSDVDRITDIWKHCRQHYGQDGDFLFGSFTIADAMFAPVVTRFATYDVPLDPICRAYAEATLALPAMQEWIKAAGEETEQVTPGLKGPV